MSASLPYSPLPWEYCQNDDLQIMIYDADGNEVAQSFTGEIDAEAIVHAVNDHDKLVVLSTLAEAVRAMRQAQREYFKTRNYEALTRAKRAEREVDGILAQLDGAKADKTDLQGELPL